MDLRAEAAAAHLAGPVRGDLVVGCAAAEVRRNVGPVAWCALEAIASQATLSGEIDGAAASVRSVAAALAIAPNTAHRALRRLIDLGLVEARQSRTSGGRFAAGFIRLSIPPHVLRIGTECENVPVPQL